MPKRARVVEESLGSREGSFEEDHTYEVDESEEGVRQEANYFTHLHRALDRIVRAIPRRAPTPREAPIERVRRQGLQIS